MDNPELVRQVMADFRTAPLDRADGAMLEFAEKLTKTPSQTTPHDLEVLRGHGFDDEAILEIVHITGFFNYINRVADALGVDPEPEWNEFFP